jgi:hypothetical protein
MISGTAISSVLQRCYGLVSMMGAGMADFFSEVKRPNIRRD